MPEPHPAPRYAVEPGYEPPRPTVPEAPRGHSFSPSAPGRLAPKEARVALLLLTVGPFVGLNGLQHFYLGRVAKGMLWLLTFGLLGVGQLYDLCTLPAQIADVNRRRSLGIPS